MKKEVIIFAGILVLVLPLINSIEIEMDNEFNQGETILAKISGSFIEEISEENFHFYRGHSVSAFDFGLTKILDEYYLFISTLGKGPENYTLRLEDIIYRSGFEISEEDIEINFTLNDAYSDFSITPGFGASNEEISFSIQNLQNKKVQIDTSFEEDLFNQLTSQEDLNLISGKTQEVIFSIKETNKSSLEYITFSSENTEYEIPIYVLANKQIQNQSENQTQEIVEFKFHPKEIITNLTTDKLNYLKINLENTGNVKLENISLVVSKTLKDYVNVSYDSIESLDVNETAVLSASFFSIDAKSIVGSIYAKQGSDKTVFLPIEITFIQDYISQDPDPTYNFTFNSSSPNEDKPPVEKSSGISSNQVIGWGLGLLAIIIAFWFYKTKYKKTTNKKINLLNFKKK